MIWKRGRLSLLRFSIWACACLKRRTRLALLSFAVVLLLILQGCCSSSSTPEAPPLPVLKSLQRATLEGAPGLWMNDTDAGTLASWIYAITGVSGL